MHQARPLCKKMLPNLARMHGGTPRRLFRLNRRLTVPPSQAGRTQRAEETTAAGASTTARVVPTVRNAIVERGCPKHVIYLPHACPTRADGDLLDSDFEYAWGVRAVTANNTKKMFAIQGLSVRSPCCCPFNFLLFLRIRSNPRLEFCVSKAPIVVLHMLGEGSCCRDVSGRDNARIVQKYSTYPSRLKRPLWTHTNSTFRQG